MASVKLVGDTAVLVCFEEKIDLKTNRKVRELQYSLEQKPLPGLLEMIPAYCSLLVFYDPFQVEAKAFAAALGKRASSSGTAVLPPAIVTEIPVLYEDAPDLEEIASLEHMTVQEVIRIHSGSDYFVYMIGFAPGHAYTARFSQPFSFRRRAEPRMEIPQGSIVVMEAQSDIIPFAQPCGWNIIGRTPILVCDYRKENPFLLAAGQWVRYVPISKEEYRRIGEEVRRGVYRCRTWLKAEEPQWD